MAATDDVRPATDDVRPATDDVRPATDDVRPATRGGAEDRGAGGTPPTGTLDQGRTQDAGAPEGNAADDAEREQERQLAEGTESPG